MSLYELERCARKGCGHARHRHHWEGYSRRTYGFCKLTGSDGPCPCARFMEPPEKPTGKGTAE